MLEFCELLRRVSHKDTLYLSYRSTLGLLLKNMDISSWLMNGEDTNSGPFFGDIRDFKVFLLPLHTVIKRSPSAYPILKRGYVEASDYLYATFLKLLRKMNECLLKMQDCLPLNRTWGDVMVWHGWFYYLGILEELQKISEHYKPTYNIRWLLEHKNKYGYEFRRHMAREMIPKQNEDFQRSLKMVIDRFLNKATSFTNVEGHQMLLGDFFRPPRVQEDNPPDIKEKWFLSTTHTFLIDAAIKLENLHLEYFSLAGKLIALGLIHKVPVGVVFDRVFFLQLFNHPNILQYHGTDKNETKLYIFLELISNGSLAEIYNRYHLKDSQDIKCSYILVNVGGTMKLADVGLAKVTEFNNHIKYCKGTPCWMAPKVVNLNRRGNGLAVDTWSLGCTVLEMLIRKRPYSHLEPAQVLYKIGRGKPPAIP
ncbi:hypothetical protein P3X46_032124 [Hevea brasiliensis]|uniref:Protein kinase domain-containing protein n=1 Tax=Hevea brasiliensis TaxID=3981 RepID=A0ABQ9KDG2_HEVBR|nr:hypothetical protein P3X46_032124 [Hevea brasiliensis]